MTRALVVGGSKRVWDEVALAYRLTSFDAVYCINTIGTYWDRGQFVWVTLHPEHMPGHEALRRKLELSHCYRTIGPLASESGRHQEQLDERRSYRWPEMTHSGSSGLFAVKLGLEDGHDQIILAGVPMEPEEGHFMRHEHWTQCMTFRRAWEEVLPRIKDNTRSLSGWTKQLLGEPTQDWIFQRL